MEHKDREICLLFHLEYGPGFFLSSGMYSESKYNRIIEFMRDNEDEYPYQVLDEDYYDGDQSYEYLRSHFKVIQYCKNCPFDEFINDITYAQILNIAYEAMELCELKQSEHEEIVRSELESLGRLESNDEESDDNSDE